MRILKNALAIVLATIWISISEFVRNEYLVKSFWTKHYQGLGLTFPSASINGAIWGAWSLLFAVIIFIISRKFSLLYTTIISWLSGFMMMWVVIGNLGVLPFGMLGYAIPLSVIEALIASLIIKKTQVNQDKSTVL
jgi:hypothetical protein